MKYTLRKDKKKRLWFWKKEKTVIFPKVFKQDQSVSFKQRFWVANSKNLRNYVPINNHCYLTTRCGGVLKPFKLSRIRFRELANLGFLPGIRRASW